MKETFHRFSIYSSNGIMETKKEDNYMEAAELGKFIATIRKEKQLTQAELARKLNVTDKAVSRWERGVSHS